jgi:hypothetical protein
VKVKDTHELGAIRPLTGLGPALASWGLRVLSLGLIVGAYDGCLVTDEIMFEGEPNVPPVILDTPDSRAPIGSHIWIDSSADTKMWTLDVLVRDENIDQPLVAHWRIVSDPNVLVPFFPQELQPGQLERDLTIRVQTETLKLGVCHRLELKVSGSFLKKTTPPYFDAVRDGAEHDIAGAVWWLWEGEPQASAEEKARLLDSCPESVDGVVVGASVVDKP